MRVKKIGTWEETKVASGFNHGFYLEAVDIPWDRPRYAAVAYMFIEDADIGRLDRGETVVLELDPEDLQERIN